MHLKCAFAVLSNMYTYFGIHLTIKSNSVQCHGLEASSNTLDGENKTQFNNKSKIKLLKIRRQEILPISYSPALIAAATSATA